MDPNKSSAAPPLMMDPSEEKSSMGPGGAPVYHDNPNPGYPQPGPGYPTQGFVPPPPYGSEGYGQQQYHGGQQYPGQQQYMVGQQYPGQQYSGQPTMVVTGQPTVYMTRAPLQEPFNDYLCYSIFTLLCCFMPLGIAALIYSILTRDANQIGDPIQAERSSKTARILNHVALGLGLGFLTLSIIYVVVVMSVVGG